MSKRILQWFILIVMMFFSTTTVFAEANVTPPIINDKKVLILNGFQYGLPVSDVYTRSVVDTLRASGMPTGNIFVEYLDLNRKDNHVHRSLMQKLLLEKENNHAIELIIAMDQVAADFVINEGKDMFEGVPLIVSYDEVPIWKGRPRELILVVASNDVNGTVKNAFNLFPNTQHVVIIMGKDDKSAPFIEGLITAIQSNNDDVTIEKTQALAYSEMLARIADLPENTIGFYGSYFEDVTNEIYVPAAVAKTVSRLANAPIFAFVDMHIEQGLVGGSVVIHEKLGQQVAQVAMDYLLGNLLLTNEPTRVYPDFYHLYDWKLLERWGAETDVLPSDTVFLNYIPTIWESDRELVISVSFFISVLMVFVALLLIANRKQQKTLAMLDRSESQHRESRDRLANIIKGTNVGTWELNIQSGELEINRRWAEMLGYTLMELEPLDIETSRQFVHPEELPVVESQIQQVFNEECDFYDSQFRMRHKNGNWVWIMARGKVIVRNTDGKPLLMSGTHTDITEQKQLESKIIKSEKLFRSVVDTQQEMVCRYLPDTTLLFVNDAYCRAFVKNRSELIGEKYLMFVPPDLHATELASINQLHPAQPSDTREFKVILSDGSSRWQEWTNVALFDELGEFVEIQGVGRDITKRKLAEENMMLAYDQTIEGWALALDLKDKETEKHSQRVTDLTMRIAIKMGIKEQDLIHVRRGALLHDIGKMGISDDILFKQDELSDKEWEIMRAHPLYAFEMISSIDYLRPALDIPYCHHEKWNGSGYPRGLKGEQIPLAARVFAVVDVYDALTNYRLYRETWTVEKALEYIKEQSGIHFDPEVVTVFIKELTT